VEGKDTKVVKDLTDELAKAEAKDRFYEIEVLIERMLAPQHYVRPFTYVKGGWGEIKRLESVVDGAPEAIRSPRRKVRARKGEAEIKTGSCWTFKLVNSEGEVADLSKTKDFEELRIVLPWGTHFGIWKQSLRRSLEAQKRLKYEAVSLGLMKVYPVWLDVGKAPCESMLENRAPEVILETRHTSNGDVMVETFFDYIENRKAKFFMEIDSECPINEEKFVALVKTVNTLDPIGPSKRGSIKVLSVKQVALEEEELKKALAEIAAEPVKPVVY
jgi:hypothetical protein